MITAEFAKKRAWIAFGANLPSGVGAPLVTLRAAAARLAGPDVGLEACSRIYETPCFPAGAGPDYLNFAVGIRTALAPEALLARLHEIEAEFGRTRETRWAGRSLDLDLLAMEGEIRPDAEAVRGWIDLPVEDQRRRAPEELILPHPRIQDRAFMLIPFADLAPDWCHPVLGQTVAQMLAARPEAEKTAVKAVAGLEILVN
ncbi:2-amino-4-hydroxy-6-hydroxymethyldihydropteridine diphosphokinase [Celeribacter indicus]|uniref:2-amino-4-hydroxy-6-hydroxymethyldihydropteridine pyrophosphokinase n=1 Tax=Celeribacter indicus TaxID=1208324 RepID=A0A0B5DVW6_9RHOB|nr:2-amino-4-hydroxy-6-hydroxymethyldihydropteridine diphosphokinase [Celeribacter indicus]AJE45315.1 2-amino-4-hydroxy-6-hydroxymethyldihydropteridine pyrophosphokinase [Celeribacter indicus]SDX20126.1 2-amino-4-hydroxy-6-hydroxymethyldihydropteridinediphosphokinase [Celeribacter indicus]